MSSTHSPGPVEPTDGDAGVARAVAAVRTALPLATGQCLLREVRADDATAVHTYRSRPEVTRFLGHPPLDPDGVVELLHQWRADPSALSIVAVLTGAQELPAADGLPGDLRPGPGAAQPVIGDIRVRFRRAAAMAPATTTAVEASIGYAFHPQLQGRGLATESVGAVVDVLLGAVAAHRVTARVFAPATPSTRLLTRLGFTRDGIDRHAVLAPDGRTWWDDELWSRLAGDLSGPARSH